MSTEIDATSQLEINRKTSSFKQIGICSGLCILSAVVSAMVVAQRYENHVRPFYRRVTEAKNTETMNRHRAFARLLMHATDDDRIKHLPLAALHDWLTIAKVTDESNGSHRYEWTNYTSKSDGPNAHDGEIAGMAWLVIDKTERIQELGYVSAEY